MAFMLDEGKGMLVYINSLSLSGIEFDTPQAKIVQGCSSSFETLRFVYVHLKVWFMM